MKKILFAFAVILSSIIYFDDAFALENGLVEGQWVKYKISPLNIAAENQTLATFLHSQFEAFTTISLGNQQVDPRIIDWFKIQIDNVEDKSFAGRISIMTIDGREIQAGTFSKNINEFIDIIDYAIPADTQVGSTFYSGITKQSGVQTENIITKNVGPQIRDVFDLRYTISLAIEEEILEAKYQHLFDKETGIFLATNILGELVTDEFGTGQVSFSVYAIEMLVPEKQYVPTAPVSNVEKPSSGGCLIATATYGSELSPQVQQLRELRDNTILKTTSGSAFMTGFNQFYYSFSPTIADLERENPFFKESVKLGITPLLTSLSLLNYVNIDSEAEMLSYGLGIIMMNIGMYFATPAIIIWRINSIIHKNHTTAVPSSQ